MLGTESWLARIKTRELFVQANMYPSASEDASAPFHSTANTSSSARFGSKERMSACDLRLGTTCITGGDGIRTGQRRKDPTVPRPNIARDTIPTSAQAVTDQWVDVVHPETS